MNKPELSQFNQYGKEVLRLRNELIQAKKKPFSFLKQRKIKKEIQALEEGQRDILNTSITQSQAVTSVVDKNNYKTYSSQVNQSYEMFNSRVDYGGEIHKGLVETRIAFIGGEGLSVIAKDGPESETQKYIDKFLKDNKLNGSRLIRMLEMGELEGKNLLFLKPDNKNNRIKTHSISWWLKSYNIFTEPDDHETIKKVTWIPEKGGQAELIPIPLERMVYVRIGGSADRINETTNRIHCVLTQCENYSRAAFDLRKNSHLFGKIMPNWKTQDIQEASAINNAVNSGDWTIGKGYAGMADFKFVSPPANGVQVNIQDMLTSLKTISTMTGIPIHWLAWPELMSNRATADNLIEVISAATRKDRLIWEEAFTELIEKAMNLAIEKNFESPSILGEFEVKLPLVSIALLKQVAEIWIPLMDSKIISMATVRNMLPGINPAREERFIQEQDNREPIIDNETLNETIAAMQKRK